MNQFQVIQHPDHMLPNVVSVNSNTYPDFMMLGYEILFSGTRKECEDQKDSIMEESLELNNLNNNDYE